MQMQIGGTMWNEYNFLIYTYGVREEDFGFQCGDQTDLQTNLNPNNNAFVFLNGSSLVRMKSPIFRLG